MTAKGRTTESWGRHGSRWDSSAENGYRTRSYPARPKVQEAENPNTKRAELPGRPGAAERALAIESLVGHDLMIALHGWTHDVVCLDERQVAFLRDTLNEWFPPE